MAWTLSGNIKGPKGDTPTNAVTTDTAQTVTGQKTLAPASRDVLVLVSPETVATIGASAAGTVVLDSLQFWNFDTGARATVLAGDVHAGAIYDGTNRVYSLANPGPAPVALTDAAPIATNAALGNLFRVTIAADRTLAAPTNPRDGQRALWEVTASGAARTLTLATGAAGAFKFGTDVTAVPSIAMDTTTFVGAIYRASSARWHVLAVSSGH